MTTTIGYVMIGMLFLWSGVSKLSRGELSFESFGFLAHGIFLVLYLLSIYMLHRWTPRVQIDNSLIVLRHRIFGRSKRLEWSDVAQIDFGSYQITFTSGYEQYVFRYKSNPEISIEIKRSIITIEREAC